LKKWNWDLDAIEKLGSTENVLLFLIAAIANLPEKTLSILTLGSCFGNTFDIRLISAVLSVTLVEVENNMWVLLREGKEKFLAGKLIFVGYIKRMNDFEFSFVHDKIQQAVYSMLDEESAKKNHYNIGNATNKAFIYFCKGFYLKTCMEQEGRIDYLFDALLHINKVSELILDNPVRLELAQLNLKVIKSLRIIIYR
jgi:histidine kinase